MPKKGGHEEEHENHEAWVIPYADMLTLLMVMFLALYAMGNLDLAKFRKLADALNQEMGGSSGNRVVDAGITTGQGSAILEAGPGVLEGGTGMGSGGPGTPDGSMADATTGTASAVAQASQSWPLSNIIGELTGRDERTAGQQALAQQQAAEQQAAADRRQLAEVRQQVREQVEAAGLSDRVQFTQNERGLTITLLTDQVVFAPGQADLAAGGGDLLASLAGVLQGVDNTIEVVGHTDATPTNGGAFASNWELSAARAGSVVRYLIDEMGLPANRMRLSGVGDTQPIAPNDTAEGRARNRRVEITILSTAATPTAAGAAAAPTAAPQGGAAAGTTPSSVVPAPPTTAGNGASSLAEREPAPTATTTAGPPAGGATPTTVARSASILDG